MKYAILIIGMMWLVPMACAPPPHPPIVSIDSEFLPYVTQFHSDAIGTTGKEFKIEDLVMEFNNDIINLNENGRCTTAYNTTPLIYISKQWWDASTDEIAKQTLVYHELGHCILGRLHNKTQVIVTINDGFGGISPFIVYESIMNPYSDIPDLYFQQYRESILKEYFGGYNGQ